MARERDGAVLRQIGGLFNVGATGGLTDGQLLERFATRRGEEAELAFAALVERHAAMVLCACRAVLRDEHDAQDAFQSTFLALARRAGSLWVRDSVGPWLHRVACRAALRVRRDAGRRRARERRAGEGRAAEMVGRAEGGAGRDELGGILQEEVDRLPERYRVPVVLCDLEGRPYEEAARHLGCPVGTVKSRLARGRERLRGQLTRRGVAPAAVAALAGSARAAVPRGLAEATTRAALRLAAADLGVAGAWSATHIPGRLRSMLLANSKASSFVVLAVGMALGALGMRAAAPAWQRPGKEPDRPRAARGEPAPPARDDEVDTLAWRRKDKYLPPDFDAFFPDDPEGGARLDALWNAPDKDTRPDEEILRAVREGLRRTKEHRTLILAWIGSRYIWGKSPQNPDAIEITYHAADFRGENADRYGTRHYAVYFGLSVVEPKPPAVLRTLADLCMRVDDPNDLGRVAWGAQSQRAELLPYLKPYLDSGDEATREKAAVVEKIFKGELKAFAWATEQTRKRAEAKYAGRLPEIKRALQQGSSRERGDTLRLVADEGIALIMDDSFVGAFAACAGDEDAEVRREVALIAGGRWIWGAQPQLADAIDLELRLSEDEDREVRYNAVYYGLSTAVGKREDVVRRLLTLALSDREPNLYRRISWGLENDRDAASKILEEWMRGDDPARARAAREIYRDMTDRPPPDAPGK